MRLSEIPGETYRLLRARPVQTVLVAGLAAAAVIAVLLTVGRSVSLEQTLVARTETPEGRTIAVVDTSPEGLIRPEMVRALEQIDAVERVVATTTPVDALNVHLGVGSNPVPVWGASGDIRDVAELVSGRLPEPGEALISEAALSTAGLDGPAGALLLSDGRELAVVGTFTARAPFTEMSAGAVQRLPDRSGGLRRLDVVAASVRQLDQVTVAAVSLFGAASTSDLRVERAAALAELQQLLAGDLSRFGRGLVASVLLAGMVLVALVVLAEVLARRKDFGRQRALGARRSTVILLLAARTGAAAAIGASAGLLIGLAYLAVSVSELPRPSFSIGLVVLSILAPAAGSVLPAWWAARRDPALELRTP